MKIKLLFLFILLLTIGIQCQSQSRFDASFFAGVNLCQIDGDQSGGYQKVGFRAGVGSSFGLSTDASSPWRMVVELAFTQKGSYIQQYDRTININYVEIPLMLAYCAMDDHLRLAVGLAPAIQVGAQVSNGGVDDPRSADNFTRMDWLPLTASIKYRFGRHLAVEARWQDSMLSTTKENAQGTYRIFRSNKGAFNRLLTFGLAYQF